MTRVYNDMLVAADGGQVSVLCLLDLSAALDTVDHTLLTLCLVCEVLYSSGSVPTSQTELTKSYMEVEHLQSLACHVLYLKVQYSVHGYSYCTPRTSKNTSRNMRSTTTRSLMTRSCTYTVVRTIHEMNE